MHSTDITLSPGARATCERLGITEIEVRRARSSSVSERAQPQYLVVYGELEGGRSIVMSCQHDRPWHVVSVRFA
jgi:hypothetical protein